MTEPWATVHLRSIGIHCALWVAARIAVVAQDHGGMVAGVSILHAGSVVELAACECLPLGGRGTNGIDACGGIRPEQAMYLHYGPQAPFSRLGS